MNLMNLYAIFDKVAECSGPIFEAINDGVAMRMARHTLSGVEEEKDFVLLRLGTFNRAPVELISLGLTPLSFVLDKASGTPPLDLASKAK